MLEILEILWETLRDHKWSMTAAISWTITAAVMVYRFTQGFGSPGDDGLYLVCIIGYVVGVYCLAIGWFKGELKRNDGMRWGVPGQRWYKPEDKED